MTNRDYPRHDPIERALEQLGPPSGSQHNQVRAFHRAILTDLWDEAHSTGYQLAVYDHGIDKSVSRDLRARLAAVVDQECHLRIEDIENLTHALGIGRHIDRERWGYRDHFVPGPGAVASMERLVVAGLMYKSHLIGEPDRPCYVATERARTLFGLARGEGGEQVQVGVSPAQSLTGPETVEPATPAATSVRASKCRCTLCGNEMQYWHGIPRWCSRCGCKSLEKM